MTASLAVIALVAPSAAAGQVTSRSKLTTAGLGPVRIGMTIDQAERAAGTRLRIDRSVGGPGTTCFTATLRRGPRGVYFLGTGQRIAVVSIYGRGNRTRTPSGAGIGTSEARIKRLFPGRIRVTPHPYTGPRGHYLTFVPRDRADANRRIIFETDGRKVTSMRAGRLPEVGLIEGCA